MLRRVHDQRSTPISDRRPGSPGSSADDGWPELANRLAKMSRDLVSQDSFRAAADRVTAHAVTVVPGCDAAGIAVLRRSTVTTLAATDYAVHFADRLQAELGEGPCFPPTAPDADPGPRVRNGPWPRWAAAARAVGVGTAIALPLPGSGSRGMGTLVLYSSAAQAFTPRTHHIARVFVDHAATALAGAHVRTELQRALQTSRMIGQAVGILMARRDLTGTAAFELLTVASQRTNTKLRTIAEEVVDTGEIPDAYRR